MLYYGTMRILKKILSLGFIDDGLLNEVGEVDWTFPIVEQIETFRLGKT